MKKALSLAAAALALALATAFPVAAQHGPAGDRMSIEQVHRTLTEQGFDVRSIVPSVGGIYKVEIRTTIGTTVFMGFDPLAGRLLPHAFIGQPPPATPQVVERET